MPTAEPREGSEAEVPGTVTWGHLVTHVEPLVPPGFAAFSENRHRISFASNGNEASPSHSFSDNSRAEKTCLSMQTHISVIEK